MLRQKITPLKEEEEEEEKNSKMVYYSSAVQEPGYLDISR